MARSARRKRRASRTVKQGLPPGAPVYVGEDRDDPIHVEVLHYDPHRFTEARGSTPADLAALTAGRAITWVNVDGLHDARLVEQTARAFQVHPLWIEDLLNATTRPKVERLGGQLLVIARTLEVAAGPDAAVESELNGFVLGPNWLLALQERPGDCWGPVRLRLREGGSPLRSGRAEALLHALLDAIVDRYFVVLERLEAQVEEMEDAALAARGSAMPARYLSVKADLAVVRAAVQPLRDGVATILRLDAATIPPEAQPLWRDLSDHLSQAQETSDALRERLVSALNIHLAVANQALNEVMRLLAVVSTLFIPLTFIVGVYGMNFEYMPELHWAGGYPLVMATMFVLFVSMLAYFRRRGWF